MTWGWIHNFPVSKDTFTKPIDYPDEGWDTIIANWWQDVFDAVEAVQEYVLTLGFVDRGDPADDDFTNETLIGDTAWRDLDLSSIVGSRVCLVGVRIYMADSLASSFIWLQTKGNVHEVNVARTATQIGWVAITADIWVFTDTTGKIQYSGNWSGDVILLLSVFTWSPK